MSLLSPETIDVLKLPALPLEDRADLPNAAGIYFVLSGAGDILYVGRAKKLCFRFASHHRFGDFKRASQVRIAYLTVTDATLLPEIERAMIAYFDPPLNRPGSGTVSDPVYFRVAIRLPLHIYEEICRIASEEDRTMSEQVLHIVRLWYAKHVKKNTPPLPSGEAVCDVALR